MARLIGLAFATLAARLRAGLEACSYSVFWRQPIEWPTEAGTEAGASSFREPLLLTPRTGSRPEKHPRKTILDGILYMVRTDCAWRYADWLPAAADRALACQAVGAGQGQTVHWYFKQWEQARVPR